MRWICRAPAGVLSGPEDAEVAGKFQAMLLRAPGTRVEGGTDEIMRNIIAERVLGLPGDIRVDKDVPFNKIPTKGESLTGFVGWASRSVARRALITQMVGSLRLCPPYEE